MKKLKNIYKCSGISGNGHRNYALIKITNENTLYYLDDDNIIIYYYIFLYLNFFNVRTIF